MVISISTFKYRFASWKISARIIVLFGTKSSSFRLYFMQNTSNITFKHKQQFGDFVEKENHP